MFREIKKKQVILENRKPYSGEVSEYIAELNLADWAFCSMRLSGCRAERFQIEQILKGNFVPEAALGDHLNCQRYQALFQNVSDRLALGNSLDKETFFLFHRTLTGEESGYRRDNPVLLSLDYNPPYPSEIGEQMDILMNWFFSEDMESEPLRKAAYLHHRVIEIYPFSDCCEAVARAAMYYCLMAKGFPPFFIGLSEQEYNQSIIAYLKKENVEPFLEALERSLYNKMEVLMQLTAD